MAHTSEGGRDAWRIPKPHSSYDDIGAGADAQPHEARVGPFRAPGRRELSEQREQRGLLITARNAQSFNNLEMRLGQCPFGRSPGQCATTEHVQKIQAAATLVAAAFSACAFPCVCPAWLGSPHELFRASPRGL